MNQLVPIAAHVPALVAAAGERAQTRFWEFFVSNIRNPHTRRAYGRSIAEFDGLPEIVGERGQANSDIVEAPHQEGALVRPMLDSAEWVCSRDALP